MEASPGTATESCACEGPPPGSSSVSDYRRKDHFHQRAQREGFRSRAAYKLEQIDRAQRLMRPGQRIVDLGCWPGGWLQVASRAVGRRGRVVGVDLKPLDPPLINENVVAFTGDIEGPEVCERVLEELGGRAHLLLCDAAPNLTGIRDVDRAHEEALLEAVRRTIPSLLQPHGNLLVKILEAPEARVVELSIRRLFKSAKSLKPAATRKGSSERYLLARDLAEC